MEKRILNLLEKSRMSELQERNKEQLNLRIEQLYEGGKSDE